MSADAYRTCPQCFHLAEAAFVAERRALRALFDTMTVEEYERRYDALRAREPNPDRYLTFEEFIDITLTTDGKIAIEYSGECRTCSLSYSHTTTDTVWSPPA
ncbi:MAG: hypothetical protein ABW167_19610 [Baekduia sp.]